MKSFAYDKYHSASGGVCMYLYSYLRVDLSICEDVHNVEISLSVESGQNKIHFHFCMLLLISGFLDNIFLTVAAFCFDSVF